MRTADLAAILVMSSALSMCSSALQIRRTRAIPRVTTVFNSENITVTIHGIYVAKKHAIFLITIINTNETPLRLSRTGLAQTVDKAVLLVDGIRVPLFTFLEPAPTVNLPPVAIDDIYIDRNSIAAVVTDSTFSGGKLDIDSLRNAIGRSFIVEGVQDVLIEPKDKPACRVPVTVTGAVPIWGTW